MSGERPTDERAAGLVFEALGAASVCWEGSINGIFIGDRAAEIGRQLLTDLGFEVPESYRLGES